MTDTIILTLFNRPEVVLVNTLLSVCKNDLRDTEVLIVEDGCTRSYEHIYERFSSMCELRVIKRDSVKDVGAYHIDGHNNPAYVNNEAIREARGERLFWLSSDCMLQPGALSRVRQWDLEKYCYSSRVIDLDTGKQFNPRQSTGPFPMCWFQSCLKSQALAIGGFDETYCKGMGFEDNDWSARLALHVGVLVLDLGAQVWHQSHPYVAYSDNREGFNRSRDYTVGRWGGIPWAGGADPIKAKMKQVADCLLLEVSCDRVPGDWDRALRNESVCEVRA